MITHGTDALASIATRGKFGSTAGVGFARCGNARCGSSKLYGGIYQRKRTNEGYRTSRMRAYRPTNPQTVPQELTRSNFADAMSSWGGLTPEEQAPYNKRARRLKMSGYNLYVREYLQAL